MTATVTSQLQPHIPVRLHGSLGVFQDVIGSLLSPKAWMHPVVQFVDPLRVPSRAWSQLPPLTCSPRCSVRPQGSLGVFQDVNTSLLSPEAWMHPVVQFVDPLSVPSRAWSQLPPLTCSPRCSVRLKSSLSVFQDAIASHLSPKAWPFLLAHSVTPMRI